MTVYFVKFRHFIRIGVHKYDLGLSKCTFSTVFYPHISLPCFFFVSCDQKFKKNALTRKM